MKIYVSNIEESYKDTIIGHLVNSGIADLLLHIVQCWRAYAVNKGHLGSTYGSVLLTHDV